MLEVPGVGAQLIGELLGANPTDLSSLSGEDRERVREAETKIDNPFHHWLRLKGELMYRDLQSIATDRNLFQQFVEQSI